MSKQKGKSRSKCSIKCSYCGRPAALVSGSVVYPHRPDLAEKRFYHCAACAAWVGCHPGTTKPLGTLADAKTRQARLVAHAYFDPIWKHGKMRRKDAYAWLAKELGIPVRECHISWFSAKRCRQVVAICAKFSEEVAA